MKVFQSTTQNNDNDNAQPIKKLLNLQNSTISNPPDATKEIADMHRGRTKRRFSELASKKSPLSQSQSPFAALSNPRKYIKKRNKTLPKTPPPRITNKNVLSLSDMSGELMPTKQKALTAFSSPFIPKTPPFSSSKNTLKPKTKNKIRSKSPLGMLFGYRNKNKNSENENQFK
eukprot:745190_1